MDHFSYKMLYGLLAITLLVRSQSQGVGRTSDTTFVVNLNEANFGNFDGTGPKINMMTLAFEGNYGNDTMANSDIHSRKLLYLTIYYTITTYSTYWRINMYTDDDSYARYILSKCDSCDSLSKYQILYYLDSDNNVADSYGDLYMYAYSEYYIDVPISSYSYVFGLIVCVYSDLLYCYNQDLLTKLALKFESSGNYFAIAGLLYLIIS